MKLNLSDKANLASKMVALISGVRDKELREMVIVNYLREYNMTPKIKRTLATASLESIERIKS